jgi:hypothetical protein
MGDTPVNCFPSTGRGSRVSDHESHSEIKIGSERSFGLTFAAVFLVLAVWPWVFHGGRVRIIPALIAVIFLAVTLIYPPVLAPLNRLWFKFGLALAKITGPIVMLIVFVLAIIPTAVLKRRFGKDALRLKREPNASTYWIERPESDPSAHSMKRQF